MWQIKLELALIVLIVLLIILAHGFWSGDE